MSPRLILSVSLATLSLLACSSDTGSTADSGSLGVESDTTISDGASLHRADGSSDDPSMMDGTVIAADGSAAGPDTTGPEGDASETTEDQPIVVQGDPNSVALDTWFVTGISADDAIGAALDAGSFVSPSEAGVDGNGHYWSAAPAEESGAVSGGGQYFYAATTVITEEPTGLIVRAGRLYNVWLNGVRLPADVYKSGKHRVPFRTQAGANSLVVQGGGGADALVQLWTTDAELYVNWSDAITPHLIVDRVDTECYVGAAVLNLSDRALPGFEAHVVESEHFEATTMSLPSFGPGATSQVAFALRQKQAVVSVDDVVEVTLRLSAPALVQIYETTVTLTSKLRTDPYKRTFLSSMDGSAQYYGVREPTEVVDAAEYGLALSLHGAQVEAINQASSYAPKTWTYVAAATNRRPFGFDWEEWGRLDGLEVLADAKASFAIDPTRVHVTGHSMGGHGTWQFGSLLSGRFGVVGPSAGWCSFYTYGNTQKPSGAFARARASSDTANYVSNLAGHPVYMIHGTADDNVPFSQGEYMFGLVDPITDVTFHQEPGAGHWWDGDVSAGADCLDWPPLFELMEATTFNPYTLDFNYTTPSPMVNALHSYVTIRSCTSAYSDCTITSTDGGDGTVTLDTDNVRSMVLNGDALVAQGVSTVTVDGVDHAVAEGPLSIGPQGGKTPEVYGPFNQVFQRPFCLVYPDEGPPTYQRYASYLLSAWNIIGNGSGCALPLSQVDEALREERNLVYIGVAEADIPATISLPFDWGVNTVVVDGTPHEAAAMMFVFPDGERLSAVMTTTWNFEHLLFWHQPFSSRSGFPDFIVYTTSGLATAGMTGPEWNF
jgi:hypothetical protein